MNFFGSGSENIDAHNLISKFHDITKAKEYASLQVFRSLKGSSVPPPEQTFYIRPRRTGGSVYEIARDISTGKISIDSNQSTQIRAFIPWDRGQLWCFLPSQKKVGQGLLFHPESSHFLTVNDGQLRWKFSYNYSVNESDYFVYTAEGYWIHVATGYKLSYPSGCGMGPGHEKVSINYDFDVIPAYDLMAGLLSQKIFWSNTNDSESLQHCISI